MARISKHWQSYSVTALDNFFFFFFFKPMYDIYKVAEVTDGNGQSL